MSLETIMTAYILPPFALTRGLFLLIKGREVYSRNLREHIRVKDIYSRVAALLWLAGATMLVVQRWGVIF